MSNKQTLKQSGECMHRLLSHELGFVRVKLADDIIYRQSYEYLSYQLGFVRVEPADGHKSYGRAVSTCYTGLGFVPVEQADGHRFMGS